MAGEFPLHVLIIIAPGTKLPREGCLTWHLTAWSCPAQSPEQATSPRSQLPSYHAQEAKWAVAHRLTMYPGTKGMSPKCSMATGGVSWPHDPTAF